MNILPFGRRVAVISMLVEGMSIRSIERLLGIHHDTIIRLALRVGIGCQSLHDNLVRDVQSAVIEIDEIWTFVNKKQARLSEDDSPHLGDQYTFVAMDADTKLVLSYLVSKRTLDGAVSCLEDLRARVVGRPQITTDGFSPYVEAVELAFGDDVDFAMLVKDASAATGSTAVRSHRVISGLPDPSRVSTSYIERLNLTTRMQLRRFARSTNAHSKRLLNLRAAVALHFAWYNFVRVHETLRVTPAMEAGLTGTAWSLSDLLLGAGEKA